MVEIVHTNKVSAVMVHSLTERNEALQNEVERLTKENTELKETQMDLLESINGLRYNMDQDQIKFQEMGGIIDTYTGYLRNYYLVISDIIKRDILPFRDRDTIKSTQQAVEQLLIAMITSNGKIRFAEGKDLSLNEMKRLHKPNPQ